MKHMEPFENISIVAFTLADFISLAFIFAERMKQDKHVCEDCLELLEKLLIASDCPFTKDPQVFFDNLENIKRTVQSSHLN